MWEIFGNFWKIQCSRTFHTLERVCVHIFSTISQKLLKDASPPKKLFHPKSVSSKESSTPKNGSSLKIVSSSKNCLSRKKLSLSNKMFHSKNVTNPKKFSKGMQHLCVDSEFSKPHFSQSTLRLSWKFICKPLAGLWRS